MADPNYRALMALREAIAAIEATQDGQPMITVRRRQRPASSPSRADVAHNMIKEAGRPLSTQELVALLKDAGHEVGGKGPMINLASTLSRDERFESVSTPNGKAWWIVNAPLKAIAEAAQAWVTRKES